MAKQLQITYPLFVRLLEWAREDAKDDIAVHKMLERLDTIKGQTSMDNYEQLVEGLSK